MLFNLFASNDLINVEVDVVVTATPELEPELVVVGDKDALGGADKCALRIGDVSGLLDGTTFFGVVTAGLVLTTSAPLDGTPT